MSDNRRSVDSDEWYPVYTLEKPNEDSAEFTDEFLARYDHVMAEFSQLQDELERLNDEQHFRWLKRTGRV